MNRLKEILLKKSNLWHVGAIVGFIIIASIFFYPAWSGYNVEQSDVTNWVGASQELKDYKSTGEPAGWTNSMFSGMPAVQIATYYEGRQIPEVMRDAYNLWMPSPIALMFIYFLSFYIMALSFKVKPLVAALGAIAFGLSSSQIIIIEAGHITKAYAIGYAPLLIAGMVFAYRWKNWVLGVALSCLFMTFELRANHLQITYYMAFVLLALGIVELVRYAKKNDWLKFAKITGGLLVAYGIALMINMGNIIGTNEYAKYTTRGGTDLTITAEGESNEDVATSGLDKEYITDWSYGVGETFTFIVPNFKGGESTPIGDIESNENLIDRVEDPNFRSFVSSNYQYWGDQPFTSGPVYLGIIVVFLAILGLIYSKDKFRWALLAVTILTVMLSWGKNFMGLTDFFLDVVPGYNKFRAVTIILCVAQLCVPLLGVFFLNRLVKNRDKIKENLTPFFITSGAIAFLLLVFLALPGVTNQMIPDAQQAQLDQMDVSTPQGEQYFNMYVEAFAELEATRTAIFRADVLRSFAMLLLAFGTVFLFIRNVFNKYVFAGILGLLMLIDLGGVAKRYLDTEKKGRGYEQWTERWKQKYPYTAGNGDIEIFNREAQENPNILYAVDSAMNANATNFEGMENKEKARAMDWLKFRVLNRYTNYRVLDMSNPFNSSYASYFHKSIGGYHGAKLGRYQELIEFHLSKLNPSVLDMLNMKYQIQSTRTQSGDMNSTFVAQNTTAMGNAWMTQDVKVVESADEEILALNASTAATLSVGNAGLPVFVSGEPAKPKMRVTGGEEVYFLFPMADSTGAVRMDTIRQTLPVEQAAAFDLSLVAMGQGQWNWAYDEMLDSTYKKIMTLTTADRDGWDPRKETVVSSEFAENISQDSYSGQGTVEMTSYNPDNLIYKFSSSDKQLVVFSEVYYPLGWKAYVDGQEVPISRVNYVLRAVEVPAGEHTIEFVYKLESFEKSTTYAWIGSIALLLLLGGGIFIESRRTGDSEEEEEDGDDLVASADGEKLEQ